MRLEDTVISLDVAKRLKAVGVKQQSIYHWKNYMLTAYGWEKQKYFWLDEDTYDDDEEQYDGYTRTRKPDMEIYAALNIAELGTLLPEWSSSNRDYDGNWEAYPCALYGDVASVHGEKSEADARGKLLIAMMEKHPEFPDCYSLPQEVYAVV